MELFFSQNTSMAVILISFITCLLTYKLAHTYLLTRIGSYPPIDILSKIIIDLVILSAHLAYSKMKKSTQGEFLSRVVSTLHCCVV